MKTFAFVTLLLIGCSGSGNPDGGSDAGTLLRCSELNTCTSKCTTGECVDACRAMASPSAIDKEVALQGCFQNHCPQTAGVCTPDAGGAYSAACLQCIANTQIPAGAACTPNDAAECHACVAESEVCRQD